ncbi:hypothetical protein D3C71_1125240 [compost metagenome]
MRVFCIMQTLRTSRTLLIHSSGKRCFLTRGSGFIAGNGFGKPRVLTIQNGQFGIQFVPLLEQLVVLDFLFDVDLFEFD